MATPRELAPLFEPGMIGTLELRNRILMCPMGDALANDDGSVSDRQLAYFEARARGGAALLLVGSVAVAYPSGSFAATQTAASNDAHLPGMRALAERVHAHGAALAAQLVHDGPNSLLDIAEGRPLLVPSPPVYARPDRLSAMVTDAERNAMAEPFSRPTSNYQVHEATDDDLALVIEQFALAAQRAQAAGWDAIELHAGHGYLLDAFRSTASNRRDDAWGGSLDARVRLTVEVVRAVRRAVGTTMPVWCRLNAVEHFRDGGETLDETIQVAERLVAAGVDALHISAYADPSVAIGVTEAHTPSRPGALVEYARAVKRTVAVPVITFGRLEPEAAATAIADRSADFVAMGRKLLADPDLPNKLRAGRRNDVRPCIYQYRCIGNIFVRDSVACVSNPTTARELELAPTTTASPKRVLVIGGGPAGLESARLLATAGHRVTIREAAHRLGGKLAIAARADETLDQMLGWLISQVSDLDIEIELASPTDVAATVRHNADVVVVATGAEWDTPELPGAGLPHVRTLSSLASWADDDDDTVGATVAIVGGGKVGCSLAQLAARRGRDVSLIEPSGVFAPELGLPGRFRLVDDLERAGVRLVTDAVRAITSRGVDGEEERIAADTVIVVAGPKPSTALGDELRAAGLDARDVGDCHDVGKLEGAFLGAARLARAFA